MILLVIPVVVSAQSSDADKPPSPDEPEDEAAGERLQSSMQEAFQGDEDSWKLAIERLERRLEALEPLPDNDGAAGARSDTGAQERSVSAASENENSGRGGIGAPRSVSRPSANAEPASAPAARNGAGIAFGPTVSVPEHDLPRLALIVENLPAGLWRELPGDPKDVFISRAEALRISEGDEAARDRLWGWGGPKEIFDAWTSAAFDGRRLYFFGGGHHHYRGNDILVYDLKQLGWKRLYDPSYVTADTYTGRRRYIPEHGPRSVHTYHGFIYSPLTHSIYLWGQRSRHPWKFDINLFERLGDPWKAWQPLEWPEGREASYHKTALRPDGKIVIMGGAGRSWKAVFGPESESYDSIGRANSSTSIMAWREADNSLYVIHNKHIDRYDAAGELQQKEVTQIPDVYQGSPAQSGMAYDSRRDRFVLWPGSRVVWVWSPGDNSWIQHANPEGPAPGSEAARIYGKWVYLSRLDAFVGMRDAESSVWVYKAPEQARTNPTRAQRRAEGFTCSDEVHGWSCPDLQQQVNMGRVPKGVYLQCAKIVNRRVDFQGSLVKDKVCGRKATFIVEGETQIENLTIEAGSTNVNAACFRWQGGNLTLRNVHCRRGDMGFLGSGESLVIEDSSFQGTTDEGRNLGHVLYVTKADRLVLRNSTIRDPGNRGHVLKTGARETLIESSTIAGGDRRYSRVIDAFNGGRLVLRDTNLMIGSGRENAHLIAFGVEGREKFDRHEIIFEGGRVDCSAAATRQVIRYWPEKTGPINVTWAPDAIKGCPDTGLPTRGKTAQMPR